MKYLKKYKTFESVKEDLIDILSELEDVGYSVVVDQDAYYDDLEVKAIIVRDIRRNNWSELKDYALRVKDYLGDKYLNFAYRLSKANNTPGPPSAKNYYTVVELNEDTEIDGTILSFIIKYKDE
jgi:hypothetical protein